MSYFKKITQTFFSGHERTVKARKNILASFGLKGVSILINLLLIPLTIDYLNPTKYGIWITLTSVLAWFHLFDIGLGNGMRNKFAIAKANGDVQLAKTYVSTTYAIIALISIALFILFNIIFPFINWAQFFNVPQDQFELGKLVYIVFSVFCVQFVVKLVNTLFIADQRPAMSNVINTTGSVLSLIIVFVLLKTTHGSLLYLGASFSLVTVIVPFVFGLWAFNTSYKKYKPSFSDIDFSKSKALLSLGVKFFVLQGAALIVYMTDNVIITQIAGPEEVTPYNIAFKYFGIITIFFTIITKPYWSAITEAYKKNELKWIKNSIRITLRFWYIAIVVAFVMLLLAESVYHIWIGDAVSIPFSLSMLMSIYVVLASHVMIFGNFLNGVGKIKISILLSVFMGVTNIPLSIFFAKNLGLGSVGVMLATCVGLFVCMLIQPIQYLKIIRGKASGIWNQ